MKTINIRQMTLVGLMTAVICIIAPFSLNIPITPIPISIATLAIYFAITVLGMRRGMISVVIYLLLGLAGLPVFSNFTGGIGKLLGPTGRYLIGYLFLAFICGFFTDKWPNNYFIRFVGMLLGTAVCYLFGTIWLAYQTSVTFTQALLSSVIPFLPGDLVKIIFALLVGYQVRKRLAKTGML